MSGGGGEGLVGRASRESREPPAPPAPPPPLPLPSLTKVGAERRPRRLLQVGRPADDALEFHDGRVERRAERRGKFDLDGPAVGRGHGGDIAGHVLDLGREGGGEEGSAAGRDADCEPRARAGGARARPPGRWPPHRRGRIRGATPEARQRPPPPLSCSPARPAALCGRQGTPACPRWRASWRWRCPWCKCGGRGGEGGVWVWRARCADCAHSLLPPPSLRASSQHHGALRGGPQLRRAQAAGPRRRRGQRAGARRARTPGAGAHPGGGRGAAIRVQPYPPRPRRAQRGSAGPDAPSPPSPRSWSRPATSRSTITTRRPRPG
jgi:hypothetical protein